MVDSRLDLSVIAAPTTVDVNEFIRTMWPVKTTAELASATDRINTLDKFVGKCAFNSTIGVPVYATGTTAAAAWEPESPKLATEAGAGITDGTGTIYRSSVSHHGGIITTQILIDMTGLKSATSDLDIIGEAVTGDDASLGQIVTAENGLILGGFMTCLELPASLTDIDLYGATVSTGEHEDGIATLDEIALLTKGGAWAAGARTVLSGVPRPNDYLYLVNGAADTADDFTAGRFLIELYGYDA